jgi:hypothetical protein
MKSPLRSIIAAVAVAMFNICAVVIQAQFYTNDCGICYYTAT